MSKSRVEFHPEAVAEARAAREWYRVRSRVASAAFVTELDHASRSERRQAFRHSTMRALGGIFFSVFHFLLSTESGAIWYKFWLSHMASVDLATGNPGRQGRTVAKEDEQSNKRIKSDRALPGRLCANRYVRFRAGPGKVRIE